MLVVSLQARPDGEKAAVLCTVHCCLLAAEENETGPRLGQGESMFINYKVCVCVCFVQACIPLYLHAFVCVYIMCGAFSVCVCVHMCVCMYVCVCVFVCMYVCVCVHMLIHTDMYGRKKKKKHAGRQWLF